MSSIDDVLKVAQLASGVARKPPTPGEMGAKRLLLGVSGAIFILVAFAGFWEGIHFAMSGKTTIGRIAEIATIQKHGTPHHQLARIVITVPEVGEVGYKREFPLSWRPPQDGRIAVEYLPGSERTWRVPGELHELRSPWFMLVAGLVMLIGGWWSFWKALIGGWIFSRRAEPPPKTQRRPAGKR